MTAPLCHPASFSDSAGAAAASFLDIRPFA